MNNTEKIKNKLKMRKAVGIILMRDDGLVWTGKRRDGPGVRSGEKKLWQMPQGGIDHGEKPIDAAYRELEEETGTKSAKILFEHESWFEYELPNELIGKVISGFKGQRQKWFLMKFTGNDSEFKELIRVFVSSLSLFIFQFPAIILCLIKSKFTYILQYELGRK